MSAPKTPDPQLAKLLVDPKRRVAATIRLMSSNADRYISIEVAEESHSDLCLFRPGSPVEYVLW